MGEQRYYSITESDSGFQVVKPVIISGCAVASLSDIDGIAAQVSAALDSKPDTMLEYSQEAIVDSIIEGRAAVSIGPDNELFGFAQVWPYEHEGTEFMHDEGVSFPEQVLEAGSWLSFKKGHGIPVFKEAVRLGENIAPEANVIGIVAASNLLAQKRIIQAGGQELGSKTSLRLRKQTISPEADTGPKAADMLIYSMRTPSK